MAVPNLDVTLKSKEILNVVPWDPFSGDTVKLVMVARAVVVLGQASKFSQMAMKSGSV